MISLNTEHANAKRETNNFGDEIYEFRKLIKHFALTLKLGLLENNFSLSQQMAETYFGSE